MARIRRARTAPPGGPGNAPVKLKSMSGKEFRDKFMELRHRNTMDRGHLYRGVELDRDFIIGLDAMLFTGGAEPAGDGRTRYTGVHTQLPINLARMCNLDMDLLEAMGVDLRDSQRDKVLRGTCPYPGNFDAFNKGTDFRDFKTYLDEDRSMPGTPVGLRIEYDPGNEHVTSELGKFRVTPAIDFRALGLAGTEEHNRARCAAGKEPLNAAQTGRVRAVTSMRICKDGYAGMNVDGVSQAVAKCAAASGLMTVKDPKALPTPEQVRAVSELYVKTFDDVVDKLSGRKPFYVDVDGPHGDAVRCPSLREVGLHAVKANGATAIAVVDQESAPEIRRGAMPALNEAFNARWKQVINERLPGENGKPGAYVLDPAVVAMGNSMSMKAHMTSARDPMDPSQPTRLALMQPVMDYTMTPYFSGLGISVASAMDGLPDGTSPEDFYSKEMMAAAYELSTAFDDTPPPPPGPAYEAVRAETAKRSSEQFRAICDAVEHECGYAVGGSTYGPSDEDEPEENGDFDWGLGL